MTRTFQVAPGRPGAYPVIREAVLDATRGSTIQIGAGTYEETLDLSSTGEVSLIADPDAEVIIDGKGSYEPTIRVRGARVLLQGLTLRSSETTVVDVAETELTLLRCRIEGGFGAGVRVSDRSRLTMTDSTINGAQQGLVIEDSAGSVEGATISQSADDAVVIRLGADPVLRNCTISGAGNRGMYVYQSGKPTVEGCDVSATGQDGIAVTQGSSPILTRCYVHDTRGVGISFAADTTGEVSSCKIENTATPGLSIADGASVRVHEAAPSAAAGVGSVDSAKDDPERIEALLGELDAMVGLSGVKSEVKAIIDEIQVQAWRRSAGLNVGGMSHHLIFAGAPGTGKTTVGRIYGQLLAALGVLPGGPLREVSRRDLVGQYIGHTAEKTAAVFDEAVGGVVFLDEAYTLSRQVGAGGADFGQEAIDTIVKLMEDRREQLAVIAAGYTSEMMDFLDANPGLASRFVKTIEFENYSADELTLIISRMISSGDYQLAEDGEPLLRQHFETIDRTANFGNARDARKLFELLRKVQSQRLRTLGRTPDLGELQLLTADDVRVAVAS